jgi:hypothetical protein
LRSTLEGSRGKPVAGWSLPALAGRHTGRRVSNCSRPRRQISRGSLLTFQLRKLK